MVHSYDFLFYCPSYKATPYVIIHHLSYMPPYSYFCCVLSASELNLGPGASNGFCSTLDILKEEGLMKLTFKAVGHLYISLYFEA